MEKIITSLFSGLDEFVSGKENDIEKLKALAREVVQTYQQIPFLERYHTIQSLLLNIAGLSGDNFFQYLAEEIRQILNANLIIIAQINPSVSNTAQTIVVNYKGSQQKNFEYSLEYCPCGRVVSEKKDFFQQHIAEVYPEWAKYLPPDSIHYYGTPLFGPANEVIGLLIALFDHIPHQLDWAHLVLELVSGRVALELLHRRSEQLLKENERKMQALLETITDYLIINKVRNGQIAESWHSPTCVNVTGYSSAEYTHNPLLWFNMIHEHDKVYVMDKIKNMIESGEARPFEHRIVHKNGTIRWIRNTPILFKNIRNEIEEIHNVIQDITETKQIELKLLEHEQQYRLLFNQMNNGFVLCQPIFKGAHEMVDFAILDINPAFEKIVGVSREKIINKKASEFSNAVPKAWMQKFTQVVLTGDPIKFEDYYDPLEKYLELTVYAPQENSFGIIISDITEKTKANQLLEASEQRYKALVEFSPDSIFWIQQKRLVFANRKGYELLGIDPTEDLSKYSLEEFLPEKMVKILHIPANNEILLNQKHTYLRAHTGKTVPVEITVVPMSLQEESFLMLVRDISEKERMTHALAESEQRFILAMEAVNDGVFEWDVLNDKVYFSDRNYTMLGYQPGEFEPNHLLWDQMIHPEDRTKNYAQLRKHLKGETEHYEIEYRIRNKQGNYQWILERGKIIDRDPNGRPLKIVGIHSDIASRKQMEESLRKALEKAEEANRLKSAFLANMSHEIRTPMNGILGFSALLDRDDLTPDKRKLYIDVIKSSSKQLLNIVNDILDISKIASGQLTLLNEPFHLHSLLETVFKNYSEELLSKGLNDKLDLILSIPPGSTPVIVADKYRIQQVLEHLINNAIKFTPEGTIEFGYKEKDEVLEFFVRDTGIGIDADKHQLIFESFRQIDMSDARRYGGLGIGLSICHGLVTLMGGNIWLDSEPAKGSTFYFSIPLRVPSKSVNEARPTGIPDKFKSSPLILIVEDVEDNYFLLEELLSPTGAQLLHAVDGKAALHLLDTHADIKLVLLDLLLPDISGYELFSMIKKKYPYLPVIAQTAYALTEDEEKVMKAGFDGYINKPIDKNALLQLLQKILTKDARKAGK